jgi:serine protease AprX
VAAPSEALYELVYLPGTNDGQRFTQDTPVLANVWLEFVANGSLVKPIRLLLTPDNRAELDLIIPTLRRMLDLEEAGESTPIGIESQILVKVDFRQLLLLLQLTGWWQNQMARLRDLPERNLDAWLAEFVRSLSGMTVSKGRSPGRPLDASLWPMRGLLNLFRTAAGIAWAVEHEGDPPKSVEEWLEALARMRELRPADHSNLIPDGRRALIWRISLDRPVSMTIAKSCATVKGDAARRLFDRSGQGITWAVIDGGVDATHPAFGAYQPGALADNRPIDPATSRVRRTFDFTRLEPLLTGLGRVKFANSVFAKLPFEESERLMGDLRQRLQTGKLLDWSTLSPFLEVPHTHYELPKLDHGTHVAGILGANWPLPPEKRRQLDVDEQGELIGMCPDIDLVDIRVFSPDDDTFEFQVIAALQFVRWLNAGRTKRVVHGVNLSLSLPHDVRNYGCGRTPVCEEVDRLVESGRVVVVVAAGNAGYSEHLVRTTGFQSYSSATITDPGNAELAITVGSVHRTMPHAYGVSYFSSRGPTGDGRLKPDLVAPGEKITAPVPGCSAAVLDGTSMAAPHVSGAAALLLARRPELIDRPREVKRLLCKHATPLGRERYYEGCGLVDALRALQAE